MGKASSGLEARDARVSVMFEHARRSLRNLGLDRSRSFVDKISGVLAHDLQVLSVGMDGDVYVITLSGSEEDYEKYGEKLRDNLERFTGNSIRVEHHQGPIGAQDELR